MEPVPRFPEEQDWEVWLLALAQVCVAVMLYCMAIPPSCSTTSTLWVTTEFRANFSPHHDVPRHRRPHLPTSSSLPSPPTEPDTAAPSQRERFAISPFIYRTQDAPRRRIPYIDWVTGLKFIFVFLAGCLARPLR